MKSSINALLLIKTHEGYSLEAYKCPAGVWTIGYGHTSNVKQGDKITQFQADTLLSIDLQKFEYGINKAVKVELNQNQFDALVSLTFNIGIGAFQGSTLLKLLNKGDYTGAANQFDRWIYSNGKKLAGLIKRRAAEKQLFLRPTFCREMKEYL